MNRFHFRTICIVFFWPLFLTTLASAEILETPHFLIIYSQPEAALASTIAKTMEEARATLTEELGVTHDDSLRIKLVPHLTSGGEARYLPDRRVIEILTTEAMTNNFDGKCPPIEFIKGVLWHEYTHFLQHQVMKRFIKDGEALWFIEGTAEYLGTQKFFSKYSPEAVWKEGKPILSDRRLPTLEDLNRYHRTHEYPLTTYFFSADAVAFLVDKWGMEPLREMTVAVGEGKELSQCLSESLGIDLQSFEREWHRDLETRYKHYIRDS